MRILSARGGSTRERARWTSAAVKNLPTWWFEPSPHADRLRVTYEVGAGPPQAVASGELQVQLASDALVTARATR